MLMIIFIMHLLYFLQLFNLFCHFFGFCYISSPLLFLSNFMANENISLLLWRSSTDGSNPGLSTRLEGMVRGLSWGSLALGRPSICWTALWKACPPSGLPLSQPFSSVLGEQDGKLSLLDRVFPFWDMLSLCFCQYNVQCLSHPSTRELHWFWWEEPLNVRGRDGDCISLSLTTIKCLQVQPSGRGRYLCL